MFEDFPINARIYSKDKQVQVESLLLKLPLTIVQRADLASLQPPRNAVLVERVLIDMIRLIALLYVARSPSHRTLFTCALRVRLAFNAQVHNMVPTNGAVVHGNIPRPESYRIPLRNKLQVGHQPF